MSVDGTLIRKLVFWPAVVTLGITLLRLTGELLHWSPSLFNPAPGGGGALVGISWLPPVFGILFAIQLARAGHGPRSGGRAIGMAFLGLVAAAAVIFGGKALGVLKPGGFSLLALVVITAAIAIGAAIAWSGWPALGQLGHALRRGASGVPGDGRVRQVADDRCAAAAHHLDRVHRADGRTVRIDRGGHRLASPGVGEGCRHRLRTLAVSSAGACWASSSS